MLFDLHWAVVGQWRSAADPGITAESLLAFDLEMGNCIPRNNCDWSRTVAHSDNSKALHFSTAGDSRSLPKAAWESVYKRFQGVTCQSSDGDDVEQHASDPDDAGVEPQEEHFLDSDTGTESLHDDDLQVKWWSFAEFRTNFCLIMERSCLQRYLRDDLRDYDGGVWHKMRPEPEVNSATDSAGVTPGLSTTSGSNSPSCTLDCWSDAHAQKFLQTMQSSIFSDNSFIVHQKIEKFELATQNPAHRLSAEHRTIMQDMITQSKKSADAVIQEHHGNSGEL